MFKPLLLTLPLDMLPLRSLPAAASLLLIFCRADAAEQKPDGAKLMTQALAAFEKTPAAYLQQRSVEGQSMRMQVFVDPGKGIRVEFLAPSIMSKMVGYDNFKEFRLYDGESKTLTVAPSQFSASASASVRAGLVRSNYSISVPDDTVLAGREVWLAKLTSRRQPGLAWSLLVDKHTSVILQLNMHEAGGAVQRRLDTHLAYFSQLRPVSSDLKAARGAVVRRAPQPIPWVRPDEAVRHVGFRPSLPARLPMGFRIIRQTIKGESPARFVALDATDGLFSATILMWHGKAMRGRGPAGSSGEPLAAMASNDVGLFSTTLGDAPAAAKAALSKAMMDAQKSGPRNSAALDQVFEEDLAKTEAWLPPLAD
jgi:hypothetical protein